MSVEMIRAMYRYNAWANTRILDTAARLRPDQLVTPGGAGYDSVRDTLVHTMSAQWTYLERWHGRSPRVAFEARSFSDLASIRSRWDEVERDTAAFTAAVDEEQLGAVIEYLNFQGEKWAYPLWQQMVHQVNHATQHRSEAAMLLTHLGHSPGGLDFLYYLDLRAGTATSS